MVHPSAAQLSIASKVASSRFCDLLDHLRKGSRIHYGQERGDEGDEDTHQAQQRLEMCVRLVVAQPAEFLRYDKGVPLNILFCVVLRCIFISFVP